MSWFNPYAISFWDTVKLFYHERMTENDLWQLVRYAMDEQIRRKEEIVRRVALDIEEMNMFSLDNTKVIDEGDEDFSFFIRHPQERKLPAPYVRRHSKPRTPLTENERKWVIVKLGRQCNLCKKSHDLQIHHKDKNPSNNALDNLELLCYNCHKKTHAVQKSK